MLKARRALISVSDKRGLADFVYGLNQLGIDILSTGGTYQAITDLGVQVDKVAEVTGFPEILGGRVKTLHPKIHGGILADRGRGGHLKELVEHSISPIDLVVVNLYPFREATADPETTFETGIENIDIGGPTMVRAAAKNHQGVVVVVDPDDYPQVLAALEDGAGTVSETLRRRLAIKAFRHTQAYDAAISTWLEQQESEPARLLPSHLLLDLERRILPRYGENPHQEAAFYQVSGSEGVLDGFTKLQGKELSYNNLLDSHAARRLAGEFEGPAVAINKHNNPCGVGTGEDLLEAYQNALSCDPTSAFGSVIAVNQPVDLELAQKMAELFIEVLIAPDFEPAALDRLGRKKNLRLLQTPVYVHTPGRLEFRGIDGGFLVQTTDGNEDRPEAWTCPTQRRPTRTELEALTFHWKVVRNVKSNAIVVGNNVQTVGIGAGQMSRVDSCRIALQKAVLPLEGTVAASDAFFPFRDGVDLLVDAGITAIIQPGGSKRDEEVIEAADERKVAMLMTSRRHFKH